MALRGSEVMGQIEFLTKNIKVDSLLVTPGRHLPELL